jgi:hypothetical protein
MIDIRQQQQTARRLWSGCVEQVFQTLEISDRRGAHDIAETLGEFCRERGALSAQTLSLLMARSFCITGDPEAAERILRHDRFHSRHADTWLNVLSAEYPFPELIPLFSARILRPLQMASAGGEIWVLDTDRIALTEADRHEIILYQTLRTLLRTVSNVWKKTDGRGTLGVKGLPRLARMIRVRNPEPLAEHIRAVLKLTAAKNRWQRVPEVLLLDL